MGVKTRLWGRGNAEEEAKGVMAIWCPGCKDHHVIPTKVAISAAGVWGFNGDVDNPTFTPSMLIRTGSYASPSFIDPPEIPPVICHSVITAGKIYFCPDTTHDLSGQTVELPDCP